MHFFLRYFILFILGIIDTQITEHYLRMDLISYTSIARNKTFKFKKQTYTHVRDYVENKVVAC